MEPISMVSSLPSGDYIAGLVDGEGCFALIFRREVKENRPSKPVYFAWRAAFIIALRQDDKELLEKIRTVFGCGVVITSQTTARYQVQHLEYLLRVIIPFFEQYKLFGKKSKDFVLWSEAVKLVALNRNKDVNLKKGVQGFIKSNWSEKDIARLMEIRTQMITYKSARTKLFKWDA